MIKLFNFRPMLFSAIFFIFGICFAVTYMLFQPLYAFILLTLVLVCVFVVFLFSLFDYKKINVKSSTVVLLILAAIFIFGFTATKSKLESYSSLPQQMEGGVDGVITEVIVYYEQYLYTVSEVRVNGKKLGCKVEFTSNEVLSEGDIISFYGALNKISILENGNLVVNKQIYNVNYTASNMEFLNVEGKKLLPFGEVKKYIRNNLKQVLSEQTYPIAMGILIGDRSMIDYDVYSNYMLAGVVHIFAVSGMHFSFLAIVLIFLCKKLNFSRRLTFLVVFAIMLSYAFVCNFSPSVTRALIMCSLSLIAPILFVKYDSINALAFSALFILVLNPLALFSVSFLLSFSTVLAILLLYSRIKKLLAFLPNYFASAIAITVSAQIGAIPVTLYFFHTLSTYSIFANLLILPLVTVVHLSLLFAVVFLLPFKFLHFYFMLPQILIDLMNSITTGIAYLPNSQLVLFSLSYGAFALLVMLIIASKFINLKIPVKSVLCAVLCLSIIGFYHYENEFVLPSESITVTSNLALYKSQGKTFVFDNSKLGSNTVLEELDQSRTASIYAYFLIEPQENYIDKIIEISRKKQITHLFMPSYFDKLENEYIEQLTKNNITAHLILHLETNTLEGFEYIFWGNRIHGTALSINILNTTFLFSPNYDQNFALLLNQQASQSYFDFFAVKSCKNFQINASYLIESNPCNKTHYTFASFSGIKILIHDDIYRLTKHRRLADRN